MRRLSRRLSSQCAADVLHRVFDRVPTGLAFRLWDGTHVALGGSSPVCTAVVHHPDTFVRLVRDPTPLNFAEAYVEGALDVEGDLFEAMRIAGGIEEIRVPLLDRVRILLAMWRG